MAITTLDGLVNAMPGQFLPYTKVFTGVATGWCGGWVIPGLPGAGSAPSGGLNGEIPTDATPGPHVFNNAPAGQTTYLGRMAWSATSALTVVLYDRLWHNTYTITSTALQSITQPALTRGATNGDDVELWWQAYTALGAGATTLTVSYTNSSGVSGRTASITIPSASVIHRMYPFNLQAGDTGVRSVQSLQLGTSQTSGTAGLVLRKRMAAAPLPATAGGIDYDPFQTGMPVVPDDAALDLSFLTGSAVTFTVVGEISLLQG